MCYTLFNKSISFSYIIFSLIKQPSAVLFFRRGVMRLLKKEISSYTLRNYSPKFIENEKAMAIYITARAFFDFLDCESVLVRLLNIEDANLYDYYVEVFRSDNFLSLYNRFKDHSKEYSIPRDDYHLSVFHGSSSSSLQDVVNSSFEFLEIISNITGDRADHISCYTMRCEDTLTFITNHNIFEHLGEDKLI